MVTADGQNPADTGDATIESTFAADAQAPANDAPILVALADPNRANWVFITNSDGSLHEVQPAAGDTQPKA